MVVSCRDSSGKLSTSSNGKSGSSWSEGGHEGGSNLASELWGAPSNKLRGPPPGLIAGSVQQKNTVVVSGGGGGGAGGSGGGGGGGGGGSWGTVGRSTSWSGEQHKNPPNSALHSAAAIAAPGTWTNTQLPSTWLILRNLTPQVTHHSCDARYYNYSHHHPSSSSMFVRGVRSHPPS